jgi:hypothetical protein
MLKTAFILCFLKENNINYTFQSYPEVKNVADALKTLCSY